MCCAHPSPASTTPPPPSAGSPSVCRAAAAVEFKGFIVAFYLLAALPLNAAKLLSLRYASNCLEGSSQEQSVAVGGGPGTLLNDSPPPYHRPTPGSVEVWVLAGALFKHGLRLRLFGARLAPAQHRLGCVCGAGEVRGRDGIRRGGAPALQHFFIFHRNIREVRGGVALLLGGCVGVWVDGWGLHLLEMDSPCGSLAFPLWLRSGPFPALTSASSRCWKVTRPWARPWRLCATGGGGVDL